MNALRVVCEVVLQESGDSGFTHLPIAGEYLHRDAFDVARKYGKDLFVIIDKLGTGWLPLFFDLKTRCDALFERLGFLPKHLG